MAVLPLPRDPQGKIVLPGKVVRTKTWPFMTDSVLPSDLVATGTGSAAVQTTAAGLGGLMITASADRTAEQVTLANGVNLASFEAVWFEAEGIEAQDSNSNVLGLAVNVSGGNVGVYSSGNLLKSNAATVQTLPINWSAATPANYKFRSNFGLLVLPRLQHAYWMMNDAVVSDVDLTGGSTSQGTLVLGAVNPGIYVVSGGTTAVVRVQQLRLTTSSY